MINKFTLGCFISTLISLQSYGNGLPYDISNIPANLLVDAKQVIRIKDVEFKIVEEGKSQTTSKTVYTIFENGKTEELLQFDYSDMRKYDQVEVIVYDKLGKELKKYKKGDFQDMIAFDYSTFFSNARVMHLRIAIAKHPITIEVNTILLEKSSFYYPDIYPISVFDQSSVIQKYTYVMPKGYDLIYKNSNFDGEPKIIEKSESKSYEWTIENLSPIKNQAYTLINKKIPVVYVSPSKFYVDGIEGSMSSWQNFSKFIYKLNKDTRVVNSEIASLAIKISENCKTDLEKISAIYDHIQKTMRYVNVSIGIGGFKSHNASYVHKNSFGDCKALTNYTMTLLQACGISSKWVLLYRGEEESATKYDLFPNPRFNHVVLYIPAYNTWLECTSSNLPIGYIGVDNMNRQGLMIEESGGSLIETPIYSVEKNKISLISTIYPQEQMKARVVLVKKFEGPSHDYIRYFTDQLNGTQKEERFVRSIDVAIPEIENLEYSYVSDKPIAHIKSDFYLAKYATKSGNRIFLPVNVLSKLSPSLNIDSIKTDSFYLPEDYIDNVDIYYQLDSANTVVESAPYTAVSKDTPFISYTSKISIEKEHVHYHRSCTFRKGYYAASLFPSYKEIVQFINKNENTKVVLRVERK